MGWRMVVEGEEEENGRGMKMEDGDEEENGE